MKKSRTRIVTIAIFSGAVLVGGVHAGHAKADGGVVTPFGPALLGATLAVIGTGAAGKHSEPSSARENAPTGTIAPRARSERDAAAAARRAKPAAAQNADLAR